MKKFEPGQIVGMEKGSIGNRTLRHTFIVLGSGEWEMSTKVYCLDSNRPNMIGEIYALSNSVLHLRELNNG